MQVEKRGDKPVCFPQNFLRVCSTAAVSHKTHSVAQDLVIYANLTNLGRHEYIPGLNSGVAKCPFDPEDNSTAIWVENGNPGM